MTVVNTADTRAAGGDHAVGAPVLEALYQRGAQASVAIPVVLVPPHPRLFGNMDSAVLAELVWALARGGHPTLRFNFRGVGASTGTVDLPVLPTSAAVSLQSCVSDLAAAVEHHRGTGRVALVGYSVGALVAAALVNPHVAQTILVAPPLEVFPGALALVADAAEGTEVVVGTEDRWAPLAALRAARPQTALHEIRGADHSFSRGLSDLGRVVAALVADLATHSGEGELDLTSR